MPADNPRLLEIERCARGLVRTARHDVGNNEVVPAWWDALARALEVQESPYSVGAIRCPQCGAIHDVFEEDVLGLSTPATQRVARCPRIPEGMVRIASNIRIGPEQ